MSFRRKLNCALLLSLRIMRNLRTKLILALIIVAAAGINGKLLAQETPSRYSRESEAPPKKEYWVANMGVLLGTSTNIGGGPEVCYRVTTPTKGGKGGGREKG